MWSAGTGPAWSSRSVRHGTPSAARAWRSSAWASVWRAASTASAGGPSLSPFLVSIFGLPVHAIAGALLLGTFLASLAGVLGYGFLGLFSSLDGIGADPLLGLLLGLGGLMGSYLGARCQRFVPARRIKWGLALILLFTSLRYLWQGF